MKDIEAKLGDEQWYALSEGESMSVELERQQIWTELPTVVFIALTRGKFAVVDSADLAIVGGFKWRASFKSKGRIYAIRKGCEGEAATVSMHRMLAGKIGKDVDHQNHDGRDNRRRNLRPCSRAENIANARKPIGGTARFKGVCYRRRSGKWRARITQNYRTIELGEFATELEAAEAYDAKAREIFGEYACTNSAELQAA